MGFIACIREMKGTSLLLSALCFSVMPFLQNCSPDDTPTRFPEVPQGLKDWGAFKKGTYWIYKKEGTPIIDSVWVDTVSEKNFQDQEDNIPPFTELSTKFSSTLETDTYKMIVSSAAQYLYYIRDFQNGGEFGFRCKLTKHPLPKQGDWARSGPNQITYFDTIYPSFSIGMNTFTNVVRAFNNFNYAFEGDTTYIYTAKNYGIIRKEFPEKKEVWNLIRYYIVQ